MEITRFEKIAILILVFLLFAGSINLYLIRTRPFTDIEVVSSRIKAKYTLSEVEDRLNKKININVNKAKIEELMLIPGVGRVLASRVVKYREENGNFYCLQDLLNVEGVGKKKLEIMSHFLKF